MRKKEAPSFEGARVRGVNHNAMTYTIYSPAREKLNVS